MDDFEFDKRFLEFEKRMDLLITNQLILTECMDKVNKSIQLLIDRNLVVEKPN
jgi:hypothetical protein